jgi:cell division protein FtsW (lipid II flippase)
VGVKKMYEKLVLLLPWAVMLGIFQVNFQKFLPFQRVFKGAYFFDYFTVTDIFVSLLLVFVVAGLVMKKIKFTERKLPVELLIAVGLLLVAGVLELAFQVTYEPILTTPSEYFRGLFLYPMLVTILLIRTLDEVIVGKLLKSYVSMVMTFGVLALVQFVSGVFPGAMRDFTGRLTWPYVDFLTLKSGSANWAAFFVTPTVILSFAKLVQFSQAKVSKKNDEKVFWIGSLLISLLVLVLTQSYGAFAAVGFVSLFYCLRALPWKKFLNVFLVCLVVGVVGLGVVTQTKKFQILTGQQEFKFDTSATSRVDIYTMNLAIISSNPLLGVGMNQYQSYFASHQEKVLGHKLNESHVPPHAHNFFMSFWTNLGLFGVLAMLVLVFGIFWRSKFSAESPAVFVLLAIMIHGLIDSYYWQQEIAYTFWMVIGLCYLFEIKILQKEEKKGKHHDVEKLTV